MIAWEDIYNILYKFKSLDTIVGLVLDIDI